MWPSWMTPEPMAPLTRSKRQRRWLSVTSPLPPGSRRWRFRYPCRCSPPRACLLPRGRRINRRADTLAQPQLLPGLRVKSSKSTGKIHDQLVAPSALMTMACSMIRSGRLQRNHAGPTGPPVLRGTTIATRSPAAKFGRGRAAFKPSRSLSSFSEPLLSESHSANQFRTWT